MLRRVSVESKDLIELVVLPGLAALLPWRWCFALFKRFARWGWLYREQSEAALEQARLRGWSGQDERHWLWERKLVTLVDHADHYLGLSRSNKWMDRHMTVEGVWPKSDAAQILMSFHWGAGYWGLRHAAAHGLHPHALVASLDSPVYQGRSVLGTYARSRNANVTRTLGVPVINVAQHLRQVLAALKKKQTLLGVMDVPADESLASITITILGMKAKVPSALFRLATDQRIPVIVYVTGLNTETGMRSLKIESAFHPTSMQVLSEEVFVHLNKIISQSAPAWHFWGISERFFRTK